jgi:hypothetical protein
MICFPSAGNEHWHKRPPGAPREDSLKEREMLRLWVDGIVVLGSVTVLAVNGAQAEVATCCNSLIDGAAVVIGALPWVNECGRISFEHLTQGVSNVTQGVSNVAAGLTHSSSPTRL